MASSQGALKVPVGDSHLLGDRGQFSSPASGTVLPVAWEKVEARRLREFRWLRVVLAAMSFGVIGVFLTAAGGSPAAALPFLWLCLTALWFVFFAGYYAFQLKRDGVVVFPAVWWRREH